jgi:hypothetical protein
MSKSRRPTLEHAQVLAVVVIGGPAPLIDAVRRVAAFAVQAKVVTTEIASAATHVAAVRPFAIVVSAEIYSFDAAEFDALARDVQAQLISLPTEGLSRQVLEQRLTPLVLDAARGHAQS